MKIKYYICGIGYDKNNHVINYKCNYGVFDTYEEAYIHFIKLQCKNVKKFFKKESNIYRLLLQLEKCEENDNNINCIDVINKWTITNPNFKEDKIMKYSNMIKFLNDNGIMLMQAVIANEVSTQLTNNISEEDFEDVCECIFKEYLENALDPDIDIWYLVDEILTKKRYKEVF